MECVLPEQLSLWFNTLMATYRVVRDGKPIIDLLREEWGLFEGSGLSTADAMWLLADVLDDGQIVRKSFEPIQDPAAGQLHRWDDLRDEMMHENRWFLNQPMNLDRLKELLGGLTTSRADLEGLNWYRARLMSGSTPFHLSEMGAPPRHLAGHGRANPAGIPYLYLGSTIETSVAELRPHTGESASVATFQLAQEDLKFADLRDPRRLLSPFIWDETGIIELRADLPLIARLGFELTRPIHPRGAPYEYIPTQYLSEFVKSCGFHGVLYRSSVSSDGGVNVALFDPARATLIDVQEVAVKQVSVQLR
ncbi:RES domain-containing protein [Mycetocola lacteus]|uniref:RES domain-containing protein n=2 Tax=Mycetocola lacteus TaxID=76637 RepID=A0A3L7AIA3_9MICO|nr:RES domain-containing protein [Mycetocola lacteus]